MKKFFYMAAVALVALVACKKEETKTPDPDAVKLTSDAVVNVGAESNIVTIKFNSNVAWTASTKDEFIVLNKKSGDAGDAEIKATVANLPEDELGRVGKVAIAAGTASAEVVLYQGKVFIVSDDVELGIAGGTAEFTVITNLEYTMKKYDGADEAFPWAPVTFDKATGKGSFAVEANAGYDARYAYVKFTVPAIQVPHMVVDEETWEEYQDGTEDATYRVYVNQEGHAQLVWQANLADDFFIENANGAECNATIAFFNGQVIVSDTKTLYAFNPETGAVGNIVVPEGLPIHSITNDDAGNLVLTAGAAYGGTIDIYAVRASATDLSSFTKIATGGHGVYAVSMASGVKAKGDVFGNGVVSVFIGAGSDFGYCSYGIAWQITNGVAADSKYVTCPSDYNNTIWFSHGGCLTPAGSANSSSEYLYIGYDGTYALQSTTDGGANWKHLAEGLGDDNSGPSAIDVITWNGKSTVAVGTVAFWGPAWGYPSVLYLMNEDGLLAATQLEGKGTMSEDTNALAIDVMLRVEGNDLCAYVVDMGWGSVTKIKYPVL